ncbi:hypothetical protein ACQJBY_046630 [Aegilops geniculata]
MKQGDQDPTKLFYAALRDLSSTPSDRELVLKLGAMRKFKPFKALGGHRASSSRPLLRSTKPWELPGCEIPDGKRRHKYFITDRVDDLFAPETKAAMDSSWKPRGLGWVIPDPDDEGGNLRFGGYKRTLDFHSSSREEPSKHASTRTNWTMNVYNLIDPANLIQSDIALCHVLDNGFDSPSHEPQPECTGFLHQPLGHQGKNCKRAMHDGPRKAPSSPMHHGNDCPLGPKLKFKVEELTNILLGGTDTSMESEYCTCNLRSGDPGSVVFGGAETGQSRKRKQISKVWQSFTKIYTHGNDGVVLTLAACNGCFKVLNGDSKNGTSHLAKHKDLYCPCKLQPVVPAGNYSEGGGNVL